MKKKKPKTKNDLTKKNTGAKTLGLIKSETRVLKTRIPRGFSSTSATTAYKSRLKNSIFILELEL